MATTIPCFLNHKTLSHSISLLYYYLLALVQFSYLNVIDGIVSKEISASLMYSFTANHLESFRMQKKQIVTFSTQRYKKSALFWVGFSSQLKQDRPVFFQFRMDAIFMPRNNIFLPKIFPILNINELKLKKVVTYANRQKSFYKFEKLLYCCLKTT